MIHQNALLQYIESVLIDHELSSWEDDEHALIRSVACQIMTDLRFQYVSYDSGYSCNRWTYWTTGSGALLRVRHNIYHDEPLLCYLVRMLFYERMISNAAEWSPIVYPLTTTLHYSDDNHPVMSTYQLRHIEANYSDILSREKFIKLYNAALIWAVTPDSTRSELITALMSLTLGDQNVEEE